MSYYQRVLAAIDTSAMAPSILRRARALLGAGGVLQVIHVEERPVTGYGAGPHNRLGRDMELKQEVFPVLKGHLDAAGIPVSALLFRFGRASREIVDVALEGGSDLIVLGSHGSGGVRALLGSTAHAVLHHAPCDVYTVRIDRDHH